MTREELEAMLTVRRCELEYLHRDEVTIQKSRQRILEEILRIRRELYALDIAALPLEKLED